MLSQQRRSPESSVGSKRSESAATGSINNKDEQQSELSGSSDEETIKKVPSPPPPVQIPHSKTTKSSSSSSKSSSNASSPKPFKTIANQVKKSIPITFQASLPKSKSPQEKNKTIQDLVKNAQLRSIPKKSTTTYGGTSAIGIEKEQAELIPITSSRNGKKNLSVFEKIDTHNGHSSYLGTGSYSQLENCIRSCLLQDPHHKNLANHTTKYEYSSKSSKRASVLEDYSYDGIVSPNHHAAHSHSYSHHHYNDRHFDHRKKSAAELSLAEIRQVNDALAKYGIPVFSHQPNPYTPHPPQRNISDILSACRLLVENPNLAPHPNEHAAVQHVWDSIQHQPPMQTAPGYAPPAVHAASSHIFPGNQAPYSPLQSVPTHLFPGQPQQHFTGSPFSSAFHQYPGNNNFTY
ncbi:unnamed protein product [Rotaria socialis]|uniref:Uncharacterized protein n=2 Tax=Rotaria socialis TaxID=392032 RepID=A0A818AJH0_9BILA|nr:unnamed protein product [Rotaria socialis]